MLHLQFTLSKLLCLVHVRVAVQQLWCEGQKHLEMNLYRSFGNLMEAWVNEESQYPESPTPSSDIGTNFRSESLDSGVETASSDTSFAAMSCFISADNADMDPFIPEIPGAGLAPASASRSPVLSSPVPSPSSSSSPRICPSQPPSGSSTALHLKLEQAIQRIDSKSLKDNGELLTVEDVLRRRPRASFLAKQHASRLVRGQRSESFGSRRSAGPSAPLGQMSGMRSWPMSLRCDKPRSEELREWERRGLSPGLCYLEQVCQMLEEFAARQMQNRVSRAETDALRERGDVQAPDSCQADSQAAEDELSSCQRLEYREDEEPQRLKNNAYGHFRQRSVSDTTLATLHLRRMNPICRGQHLSTDVLQEGTEEDDLNEESQKEESSKSDKNWRTKIASLRREFPSLRDTKGQQMQSSGRNSARRRLSQLFRRRRTTMPV